MNIKRSKGILLLLTVLMTMTIFVGCGKGKQNTKVENTQIQGSITTLGSSALQPLVEQAAIEFSSKNPKAKINVQGGGSGAGINQVASGNVEIGNSDVIAENKIKDEKMAKELVDHKVCAIGFAMVVSKDINIKSLTSEQITDIFTGKINNWKQVGGEDKQINIINRGKSSGTRATFIDTIMDGQSEKEGLGTTQDSSGNVRAAIKQTEGAISYLALSYISEDVKKDLNTLSIDGVEPKEENIISGKYPFWSYEHMYTKGEPKGLTKAFLDYMVSKENNDLIKKMGYIPMDEMQK
ncbi:phosphate ABC transporter substrate-binding protein [Haloimpatiens lingqiaonensis]|uniref:phosphate ABC transporter substrate-binding protein n=1 Tax=Haloimpatiens lingqiaonensis TaxID=1380675 RepID=UPI0010FF106C|nr:phosphate ABC transporter substrate-binding protein [Haloimpatiens lingqiaonensis]